ncbi:hypothetical protein NC651_011638 [Populus alba x Populus x berolinensis]|nr:hypothetical protein NC651_011638 [Populus alba x Populus x berolinensis]
MRCFNSRLALLIRLTLILGLRSFFSLLTVLFKWDSSTQPTSSSPRLYRLVTCS